MKKLSKKLSSVDINSICNELSTDAYTIEDIIKCLEKPNRDFRDDFEKNIMKEDQDRLQLLIKKITPFILRRNKKDVLRI